MATIANLGSGDGFIFVTASNGTTIVNVEPNTGDGVARILKKGKVAKGVANHADDASLFENNFRYFLNDTSSVTIENGFADSATSEITDLIVGRGFEGLLPIDGISSSSILSTPNDITIKRKGSIQVLAIRSGEDGEVHNIFSSDKFLANDVLIVRSISATPSVYFADITLKDGAGNLRLNGDCSLNGENRYIMLRWDAFANEWFEMFRNPAAFAPTVSEARGNGFSVNGDAHSSALISSGGGLVINPNTQGRYVTLVSPFPVTLNADFNVTVSEVKAGDFYFIRIQGLYTSAGGDIKLFGTSVTGTIVPANTSFTTPATVGCFYTGSGWQFFSVVDIDRYVLDFDSLLTPRYAKAVYDFSVNTGATATYTIGDNVIPANSMVDIDNAIIVTKTALTSAGSAQVGIGLDGDADAIDNFRNFNVAPYNAVNGTTKVNSTLAAGAVFVSADADITLTISTAALTAGKVEVYVPYTKIA